MIYSNKKKNKILGVIHRSKKISNKSELDTFIKFISKYDYLSIQKNLNKVISNINSNKNFDLKTIKNALVELLDKSQLYLSYSEILDSKHKINKDTIELNKLFYK